MLKKEKIDRINHLAKKSKGEEGLTEEEKKEQEQLRKEYIEKFREHFKGHLNRVKFVEDLSEEELAKIQHSNFQSAVREAAINNDFQLIILSEDFNPILTVETRHKATISDAIKLGKERNVESNSKVYTMIDVNGVQIGRAHV